jgi:hypothetical protein
MRLLSMLDRWLSSAHTHGNGRPGPVATTPLDRLWLPHPHRGTMTGTGRLANGRRPDA